MAMSLTELEKSLKGLRLSGMAATMQARALQVASHEMDFIEAFGWLVQDELDRRRSTLLDRRYRASGLIEGSGLVLGYYWAKYLTIIATGVFLLPEGYEIAAKVSFLRIAIFVINLSIVLESAQNFVYQAGSLSWKRMAN